MSSAHAAGSDIGGMFAAIDGMDGAAFVAYLTEGATFRFGSAPPATGRAAIEEAVNGFFGTIAGCRHDITNTLTSGDTMVCEGTVTYTRHDGGEVVVPFVDVFEFAGELIDQYKIYIDIAPLYAD